MTTVRKRQPRAGGPDVTKLATSFKDFRKLKNIEATAKKEHEALRDQLFMPDLEKHGRPHGENGAHRAIDLPEPVDGYVRLVRRANISSQLDLDAAEKLCADRGVLDEVQSTTITVTGISNADLAALQTVLRKLEKIGTVEQRTDFDQDKLYALHQRDRELITEQELDDLLVEDVRYSFHPEKS